MGNHRLFSFDFVRVVAILFIVICHFLIFSGVSPQIGGYLGGVGNCIFFVMSGMLLGLKWKSEGCRAFDVHFAKKRYIRIASSLYPFLTVLVVTLLLFHEDVKIIDLILNFLFMGWIAKLPGNGHLWFVTVLMTCYFLFYLISHINVVTLRKYNTTFFWFLLGVFSVALLFAAYIIGAPGYVFLYIYLACCAFQNADGIYQKIISMKIGIVLSQFVLVWLICLFIYFYFNIFEESRPLSTILSSICGVSLLLLLLNIGNKLTRETLIISFLSNISFEIYLVHHGLCTGRFSVLIFDNIYLSLICLVITSLMLAFILNKVSNIIKKQYSRYI